MEVSVADEIESILYIAREICGKFPAIPRKALMRDRPQCTESLL
jgi:hypothetical protein